MYIPLNALSASSKDGGSSTEIGSWSSLIGIVTAICGNILISFALNTQRYAHMRLRRDREQIQEKARLQRRSSDEQRDNQHDREGSHKSAQTTNGQDGDAERQPLLPKLKSRGSSSSTSDTYVDEDKDNDQASKSYLKSPIWWLGISLMTVGEAGNFLAYGFAPASIVSPLGVVALISNCLIAPLLLHEEFRLRDGLGVLIAIGGCVTVVLSASGSNPKLDPDDIWHLITRWEFETYLGITIGLMVALMIASNKFGQKSVLIDIGLVALFGGYTALSTKGVASLLSNKIWKVFTFPITYLLVLVLVVTAVMQIKYINRALQRFNSTVVIPTQFVLFTISVIVGSAILYRDFEKRSAADAGKFVAGCALTFLGVWFITSGRSSDQDDEQSDDDEDDDEQIKQDVDNQQERTPSRTRCGAPRLQRLHQTDDVTPQLLVTSPATESPCVDAMLQRTAPPGTRAAIHGEPQIEASSSRGKPPMHATTSDPTLPTVAAPTTPLLEPQIGSVPNTQQMSPSRLPQTPEAGTHRLLSRQSIVDLLPGPLMSPLSSSLTAIVADSLRRGIDTPSSTLRNRTLRLHRRKTGEERAEASSKRHSIDSADLDLDRDAALVAEPRKGRLRSLSTTFGDIFSSTKRQRSRDQGGSVR